MVQLLAAPVSRRNASGWRLPIAKQCDLKWSPVAPFLSRAYPMVAADHEDMFDRRIEQRGLAARRIDVPGWTDDLHCLCASGSVRSFPA